MGFLNPPSSDSYGMSNALAGSPQQGGFGGMFSVPPWALSNMIQGGTPTSFGQPQPSVGGSIGPNIVGDPGSIQPASGGRASSPAMQVLAAAQQGASSAPTNPVTGPQTPPPQPASTDPYNPNPMSQMNLNAPAPQPAPDPYATSQLPPQGIGGNAYAG